ncbi:MAG: FAD binding domain-containing protein [Planctomycetes bacterium]|nr:FAD binding domain-containing protein [Planctomycetota bacterium]
MKVVSTRSLDDALKALRDAGPDARILAGGTDLMVEMESGRTHPALVVDVWKIDALRQIREMQDGVEIGALADCGALIRSVQVARHADTLIEAARTVGAVQIRNRATIGGNLGTASPAADLNPVLFALGARVRVASTRGERELPVEAFVKGYRTTDRAHDELITSVFLPRRPAHELRFFRKVGTRRAQSIAKVVVSAAVAFDGERVQAARISAGSVADRTLLFDGLAQELVGAPLPQAAKLSEFLRRHLDAAAAPRDDVRSTARYRRFVLQRILESSLRSPAQVR